MVLVTGLLFLIFNNLKTGDNQFDVFKISQAVSFFATGTIFLNIYGIWFFDSLTSKSRKMFYFSLPVSPLERVAITFTFVAIVVPLLFWTVFTMFDFIAVQLFNQIHETSVQMFFKDITMKEKTFENYLGYLSIVSIFTLGSLMFGKKGPVISILAIIAILSIYFCIANGNYLVYLSIVSISTLGSLMFGKKGSVISILSIIAFLTIYSWVMIWLKTLGVGDPNTIRVTVGNGHDLFDYLTPFWWVAMYFVMKRKQA